MDALFNVVQNIFHVTIYYLLPFIAVLGIMIFFHELGHFIVAKFFGVKVLKFALGFGPKLVARVVGDTEYSIRYFPLGGFVKMLGEDPEDDESPDLSPQEFEKSFENKHVLKRMAIVTAGPVFNLVLALFLFCGIYLVTGIHLMTPEIGQVRADSPASRAKLLKGDIITSIQGTKVERWSDIKELIRDKAGMPLAMTVRRDDRVIRLTVIPEETVSKNQFGEDEKSSLIGIVASGSMKEMQLGPWRAIKEGLGETWKWIKLTFLVIGKLFQGAVSIKTLGGPILIGQMTGEIAQKNLGYLVPFMAIISINLGILNLFPIPILDGGLIVFLLIELFTGKPLSIKKRLMAQKVGMVLLVLLMVIVTYNDLSRFELFKKIFGLIG
ncbi:MAG: RIP metalloprotease RseP [Deltaproteobacteria bacterium]|nr:RIP metalloprotease RseP [Deltaproteobacteria bacterium]